MLKEFADDNLKFDETGGKFFVKLNMSLGLLHFRITNYYKHLLLLSKCYQRGLLSAVI